MYLFNNKVKDRDAVDDIAESITEGKKVMFVYPTESGIKKLS